MDAQKMREIVLNCPQEVSAPFDEIMQAIGYDALYYLTHEYGGGELYIPTPKRMFNQCISRQIMKEFTGDNFRELAKEYKMCIRSLRLLIEKERRRTISENLQRADLKPS